MDEIEELAITIYETSEEANGVTYEELPRWAKDSYYQQAQRISKCGYRKPAQGQGMDEKELEKIMHEEFFKSGMREMNPYDARHIKRYAKAICKDGRILK